MSLAEDRALLTARRWRGGRFVIAAAAVVFAGLSVGGTLPFTYALAGFAIVAAAAVLAVYSAREEDRLARPVAIADRGDDFLRAVVAGLPDPVVALDRDGRVLALNERARMLAPALRQGEPVAFALRMPELIEAIGRAAAQGEEQRVVYSERVPIDRWFETIVMPVKREPNATRPDFVLMTFHDLTPLRRVEEMRADFVANASHELRTPLAALLGFIETLQGSAREDAKARERFLAIMQEQARRMARLIDDLLSLSRIEQHLHLQPRQPVDLALVLRHIADTLQPLADDNGVTLLLDADRAVIVSGDRDELLRVAENLIENAIKYGASDGADKRVEVSASVDDGDGVITVRDSGRASRRNICRA